MSVEAYFIMGVIFFHCSWLCVSIVLLIVHPPIHTLTHAPEMTIRLPFNRQSRTHRALHTWGDLHIDFIFLIFVPFPRTWHLLAQLCLPAATLLFLPLSQDEPWLYCWVYITSPLCSPLAPSGRSINWHRFYTWRNCWRQLRILLDLSLCIWAALFPHSIAQWSNIRRGTEV